MSLSEEITNDLAELLSTDDFAVSATYTPAGGAATTIKVIYDSPYAASVLPESQFTRSNPDAANFENTEPTALCRTSDVANAKRGDTLLISGVTHYVMNRKDDSTGMTVLTLTKDQ